METYFLVVVFAENDGDICGINILHHVLVEVPRGVEVIMKLINQFQLMEGNIKKEAFHLVPTLAVDGVVCCLSL